MPWLVNTNAVDLMTRYARSIGLTVDEWWRDEDKLAEWWDLMGHTFDDPDLFVNVPAGCSVWISHRLDLRNSENHLWTVNAYSGYRDEHTLRFSDISVTGAKGGPRLPDNFITQWTARKALQLDSRPIIPAKVGDRCACRVSVDGSGRIGLVAAVDDQGRITEIFTDERSVQPAKSFARTWFVLNDRDKAFDVRWASGNTTFPAYIAMLGGLAREQKKLTGLAPGRAPKPGKALTRQTAIVGEFDGLTPSEEAEARAVGDLWDLRDAKGRAMVANGEAADFAKALIALRPWYQEESAKIQARKKL